jgi:hypothetical protein
VQVLVVAMKLMVCIKFFIVMPVVWTVIPYAYCVQGLRGVENFQDFY